MKVVINDCEAPKITFPLMIRTISVWPPAEKKLVVSDHQYSSYAKSFISNIAAVRTHRTKQFKFCRPFKFANELKLKWSTNSPIRISTSLVYPKIALLSISRKKNTGLQSGHSFVSYSYVGTAFSYLAQQKNGFKLCFARKSFWWSTKVVLVSTTSHYIIHEHYLINWGCSVSRAISQMGCSVQLFLAEHTMLSLLSDGPIYCSIDVEHWGFVAAGRQRLIKVNVGAYDSYQRRSHGT